MTDQELASLRNENAFLNLCARRAQDEALRDSEARRLREENNRLRGQARRERLDGPQRE